MKNLVERNNTSFPKQLYEVMRKIQQDREDPLRYHQRLCNEYLVKSPHARGLLLYWKMGAGKSIGSTSIAESLMQNPDTAGYRVIVMASKSLHANYKKDIKKYKTMTTKLSETEIEQHISSNYTFISMNASNMLTQVYRAVKPEGAENVEAIFTKAVDSAEAIEKLQKMDISGTLDDSIIIVDEAHNLFNSITNGSKNAIGLYNLIMAAKRIKLIFLTGTPVVNNPYEIAIGLNMLNGYFVDPSAEKKKHRMALFGEDYEDFTSYFVWNTATRQGIRNRVKFIHRLLGLVSYYGADDAEQLKLYPKQLPIIVDKISMSAKQYAAYISARDREIEESTRDSKFVARKKFLQKPEGRSSSYRVRSRQFSNFLYPDYASKTYRDKKGYPRYEKYIDKLKDENLVFKGSDGLGKDESKFGLEVWSPKVVRILENIQKHCSYDFIKTKVKKAGLGPGLLYSQFIDVGVGLMGKILEANGWQEMHDSTDAIGGKMDSKKPTYAIISGEVPTDVRAELVKIFNDKSNIQGKIIAMLLITSTGAEGLDLKNIRHIHIYEPYWHWARLSQVIHRGVRMGSHLMLPLKERTVQPYIYLSDYPDLKELQKLNKNEETKQSANDMKKKIEREATTDVTLYQNAVANQLIIDSFFRAVQEGSIDCHMHYGKDKKGIPESKRLNCVMCAPTDRYMYIPNLDKDIRAPDRCEPLTEERIVAQTVLVEDQEFKYTVDKKTTPAEIHIFEFDTGLDGYVEILEDHPLYEDIRAAIAKKHKI